MHSRMPSPLTRLCSLTAALALVAACVRQSLPVSVVPFPSTSPVETAAPTAATICPACALPPYASELKSALETRVSALKNQGGSCMVYAEVLEKSLSSGYITVRPFMWRVGASLTSGQAQPDGHIMVARDIDSLNVGVRKLQDVVRTVEHEAVHVAFSLQTGAGSKEPWVDEHLDECSTGTM